MRVLISSMMLIGLNLFAAPFTSVTNQGTPYLTVTIVNELIESINERLSPEDTNMLAAVGSGFNIQQQSFWSNIQHRVIATASEGTTNGQWCHYTGLTNTASTPIERYTTNNIPTFYTNAFIPKGFRRASSLTSTNKWRDYGDSMYGYGYIQIGDIIGPWVIDDLQKAINEINSFHIGNIPLSWVSFTDDSRWSGFGYSASSWADAYSEVVNDWSLEGPLDITFEETLFWQSIDSSGRFILAFFRFQASACITATPANYPMNSTYVPLAVGNFVNAETNGGVVKYIFLEGGGFSSTPFENFEDPIYRGSTVNENTLISEHAFIGSDNYPISVLFGSTNIMPISYIDQSFSGIDTNQGYRAHNKAIIEPVFSYTR